MAALKIITKKHDERLRALFPALAFKQFSAKVERPTLAV
jgi:hypothetical protein